MDKTKNRQSNKKHRTMLDQEAESMEDIKTSDDFNYEHPDYDGTGLTKDNLDGDYKKSTS
jgi:hypothetical protein